MIVEAVQTKKALGLLDGYFSLLAQTGYTRQNNVKRFLVYLFLLDFVETIYYFLTVEDYNKINDLLLKLMNGKSCLMPYELFCQNKTFVGLPSSVVNHAVLGSTFYLGPFVRRVTEDNEDNRSTQDLHLRQEE